MRLIHTRTRELQWFDEHDCPRYAILSHTWGVSSDEVTLQEFEATFSPNPRTPIDPILSKPGYCKIREFCDEANRMELDWVWVDTCCIDKTSSSELSEAINCMYRWYEQSTLCLVWLRDVNASDISLTAPESEFRRSKWFTRGWTLQELIAPPKLLFYNKSWTCIGDRSTLAPFIEEICGVPPELFSSGKKPSDYSIPQRMSWAAKRVTTRREDIAYCLLGLFEVNMPLIYGEADAAFQRLQKKIIKKSNDQTIFAWGFCLPDEMVLSSGSLQLMSILADSPARFEGSGDIVPSPNNSLSFADYSYQLTKEGIHMNVYCYTDYTPNDHSRFILSLFCTRLSQDSRIGIRIQAFNGDKTPYTISNIFSNIFPLSDRGRQNHAMVGRIAGCKPLDGFRQYFSALNYYQCQAFLAIDIPYSPSQTPRSQEIQNMTISPYGTVIIPDPEGLTVRPLQSGSRTQIVSHNGYFAINKTSESYQAHSSLMAIFTCSLADHSPAHTNSTTLYMMIRNKPWISRHRCLFALGELGAENLSAERLRSLAWTPTIIYHNTTVSTRETTGQHQSDISLFFFTLNGQSLTPPHAIVDLLHASVPKTQKRRHFQESAGFYFLVILRFAYTASPLCIFISLSSPHPAVAVFFIYLLTNASLLAGSTSFDIYFGRDLALRGLILLLPIVPILIAGIARSF